MRQRHLGWTGLPVSAIGLGCYPIGGNAWGPIDDEEAVGAIDEALDRGVTFLDTADEYGWGHSEELVGRAIRGKRDRVVLASKVGLWGGREPWEGGRLWTRTPARIRWCLEASLRRLGTDYLDLYQDHLWWPEYVDVYLETFEALQQEGKIRYFGVSTDDLAYVQEFNKRGTCGTVQLAYSILNRTAERELLPYCRRQNLGVIVRGPLAQGKLSGRMTAQTTFHAEDERQDWVTLEGLPRFLDDLARVERLRPIARDLGLTMVQLALAYVLAHDGVSVAIPGFKTRQQVRENLGATEKPLPPSTLKAIAEAVG
jgi:myo-inositol catabolism protein IolS